MLVYQRVHPTQKCQLPAFLLQSSTQAPKDLSLSAGEVQMPCREAMRYCAGREIANQHTCRKQRQVNSHWFHLRFWECMSVTRSFSINNYNSNSSLLELLEILGRNHSAPTVSWALIAEFVLLSSFDTLQQKVGFSWLDWEISPFTSKNTITTLWNFNIGTEHGT